MPAVRRLHGKGMVAGVPEMAETAAAHVKAAGIVGIEPPQNLRGRPFLRGDSHQMEGIRHQAVTPEGEGVLLGVGGEQVQENGAVVIGIEHVGPASAPLRNVVGQTGDDNSLASRHTRRECGVVGENLR